MIICAAQTRPVKADVEANIEKHCRLIALAAEAGADAIFFHELSLTGYEPEFAAALAPDAADARFAVLQRLADARGLMIGAGAPTRQADGIAISQILFRPHGAPQVYSKKYLHASEQGFFVSGRNRSVVADSRPEIALAVCYEISVTEHAAEASRGGASVYAACVVEDADGAERARGKLSAIARRYRMNALMANCVGRTGAYDGGGKSSAWNREGALVGALDGESEGILLFDTETETALVETI